MSQVNKESAGDPDCEAGGSSNSNETSSSNSTCTSTSIATSRSSHSSNSDSNGSTSTCGSDNDGDNDNLDRHRQCRKSGEEDNDNEECNYLRSEHGDGDREQQDEKNIDRFQSTTTTTGTSTGQKCDTRTATTSNCSNLTKFLDQALANEQGGKCCACCPKNNETITSPPIPLQKSLQHPTSAIIDQSRSAKAQDTQSHSVSISDESTDPGSLLETDTKQQQSDLSSAITNPTSIGHSYSNQSSTTSTAFETFTNHETAQQQQPRRTLKPAPSPSPSLSTIDTNNNKNVNSSSSRDGLSSIKRTNFSKSASGSRLVNRSRPNVCDCLSQDCGEKKHSNRRQFIEHYYNSRTQLPKTSANATSTSSFNISTPLNRLSECDAITRRLLSSPIRTTNLVESPTRRVQVSEVDKSRRASLGTNTMTDQVFLFSSNPFKSLELSYMRNRDNGADNQRKCTVMTESVPGQSSGDIDNTKLNINKQQLQQQQQQQSRSLSVCDEETLNPRHRGSSTNHSSNLNRAISLACESRSSPATARRLLTIIPLFGCDMKSLEQFTHLGLILPPVIDSAIDHLLVNGINSIGIFRKSGVKSRILTLRQRVEANQNVKFAELNQGDEFSIYDIADLVKMWFRELKPVPLMTKELIKIISAFLSSNSTVIVTSITKQGALIKRGTSSQQDATTISSVGRGDARISTLTKKHDDSNLRNKINSMITTTHRALLSRALECLAEISSKCETNQMTSQNLAICLTPSLCATESDQNSILVAQKALEYSIDNFKTLFGGSLTRVDV